MPTALELQGLSMSLLRVNVALSSHSDCQRLHDQVTVPHLSVPFEDTTLL